MVEKFAREGKEMKGLDHYLAPPVPESQKRADGESSLRAMFARMKKKQEGEANGAE